jgi:DNA polymerase V
VLFLNLAPAAAVQGSLFIQPDTTHRVRLMELMDDLKCRYGRDRVRFACSGMERGWNPKAEFLSQRYTTRWGELLSVRMSSAPQPHVEKA